jgi:hypothetical protein
MDLERYVCFRLEPRNPSYKDAVLNRAQHLYETWNKMAYDEIGMRNGIEQRAILKALISIMADYLAMMLAEGVPPANLWKVYSEWVQIELNHFMSDKA